METAPKRRVVITGLGVVSALGNNIPQYWDNLCAGKSGIQRITRFPDIENYRTQIGGQVDDFDAGQYMDPKEAKRNDRYVQFAVAASRMALEDASLDTAKIDSTRMGVFIGTGVGGMEAIEKHSRTLFERGPGKMSPFTIPTIIANMAGGVVAIEIGARGPNFAIVSACASGSHAIGEAYRYIQAGLADTMVTGGSEAAITPLSYGGFCAMKAMSFGYNDDPQRGSRPFDAGRDGFVMGEGSGILVLEDYEHAKARGARIYCELAGYGATCDAYHITSPDQEGKGLAGSLHAALDCNGIKPEEVDYINAHGTSTPYNDKFETLAVKKVFGDYANKLMMSSTKSMTGHLLGAAGGIEAIACVKAIETSVVPPTINYETPDPDCDLDYVPNEKREAPVKVAASNNLGFGGHNATVLFRAIQ